MQELADALEEEAATRAYLAYIKALGLQMMLTNPEYGRELIKLADDGLARMEAEQRGAQQGVGIFLLFVMGAFLLGALTLTLISWLS